jgi:twitching motility two-component system response regulator PilH
LSRIMVIDDDPAGQRLIKYMLSPEGHEVITASNGMQGLQIATQQLPDLVILDVMLPGIDGFEVCHRLRSSAKTASIPIVMLSGKTQASDRDTGLKVGANEYLIKPVERQELLDTVTRLLSESKRTPEKQARVIVLIGSRGGVGTSTTATNLSVALAGKEQRTVLVDFSLSFSNLPELMGMKAGQGIPDAFKGTPAALDKEILKKIMTEHSSGVRLISGEHSPEDYSGITQENIEDFILELCSLSDYVVIDVPSSPSDLALEALKNADLVVLVAGMQESADKISSSVNRITRLGIDKNKLGVLVVDHTGSGSPDNITTENMPDGIRLLGMVHCDNEECARAEASGTPVTISVPSSRIAADIRKLAEEILRTD